LEKKFPITINLELAIYNNELNFKYPTNTFFYYSNKILDLNQDYIENEFCIKIFETFYVLTYLIKIALYSDFIF